MGPCLLHFSVIQLVVITFLRPFHHRHLSDQDFFFGHLPGISSLTRESARSLSLKLLLSIKLEHPAMIHAEEIANPDKCLILLPLIKTQNSVMLVSHIYTCLLLCLHAHFKYSLHVSLSLHAYDIYYLLPACQHLIYLMKTLAFTCCLFCTY